MSIAYTGGVAPYSLRIGDNECDLPFCYSCFVPAGIVLPFNLRDATGCEVTATTIAPQVAIPVTIVAATTHNMSGKQWYHSVGSIGRNGVTECK
ncbi:MAG: hypothetical protein R2795_02920 [Saprospiraceae bacterium]